MKTIDFFQTTKDNLTPQEYQQRIKNLYAVTPQQYINQNREFAVLNFIVLARLHMELKNIEDSKEKTKIIIESFLTIENPEKFYMCFCVNIIENILHNPERKLFGLDNNLDLGKKITECIEEYINYSLDDTPISEEIWTTTEEIIFISLVNPIRNNIADPLFIILNHTGFFLYLATALMKLWQLDHIDKKMQEINEYAEDKIEEMNSFGFRPRV